MKTAGYLLFTALLMLTGCKKVKEPNIIGIKIYDYQGSYDSLASAWSGIGINTAFVSAGLGSNRLFRASLKAREIETYIIFPVFQDPDAVKRDSTLASVTDAGMRAREDWVEFVCPSRVSYRKAKTEELIGLIRLADPDGISLDFIRQFVFWEMIYPGRDPSSIARACYCDSCIKGFLSQYKLIMPDSVRNTVQKAEWIDRNSPAEWNTYRCELITSMVRDLSSAARTEKKNIKINLHAVPWREGDFGNAMTGVASQDLRKISPYVDFISPMCYSQMVKQDAEWIADVTRVMDRVVPGKILPSIQVTGYYNDMVYSNEDFKEAILKAVGPPSRGVIFFSWPLFASDPSRIDVAKAALGRN